MSRSKRKSNRGKPGQEEAAKAQAPDTPAIATRDLTPPIDSSIDSAEWQHMPWPAAAGERAAGFQAVIKRSVLNAVHRHGQTSSEVEVCGVLVGNVVRDEAGPFLVIDASICGDFAGNSAAQVTFTAETWNHIQGVMDKQHPQQRIVGWYHTHPGFGIFLSDMDLFIHGNFFNLAWQVALVHDPCSGEDGMFLWRDGKAECGPLLVEEDAEREIVPIAVSAEMTAAALADFSRRMQRMEKRQKVLLIAVGLMAMIAVVWPLVLFTVMGDRRTESRGTSKNRAEGAGGAASTNPVTTPATMPAATQPIASTDILSVIKSMLSKWQTTPMKAGATRPTTMPN